MIVVSTACLFLQGLCARWITSARARAKTVFGHLNNLAGVPWKRGTGTRFFTVYRTGVNKMQAVRFICRFYSCDKKLFYQGKCETHVLLFTYISYERKYVSDLSMFVFGFPSHTFMVYLRNTKVHNNSVYKELTLHFLLQKSHLWNPPMPSDFQT